MQLLIMAKNSKNGQKETTISVQSTSEEEKHLQTLSKHKHIYDLFIRTGELVGFAPHIRADVIGAYTYFFPYYRYNDGCSACITEMIHTIYSWYQNSKNV